MSMSEIWQLITSMDFWEEQINRLAEYGMIVPVMLAALESFVPPLPMVGIVAITVAAHGVVRGILYCWMGTCIGCTLTFLFFRYPFKKLFARFFKNKKWYQKADGWVKDVSVPALFLIIMMPFTPSAFVNFAFGLSDFEIKKYLLTLYGAKVFMISGLALLGKSALNAINDPRFIAVVVVLFFVLYFLSKKVSKKHDL